jgi:hypothetical protein
MLGQTQSGWPVRAGVWQPGKGPSAHVSLAGIGQFPPEDGTVVPTSDAGTTVYERDGLRLEDRYEPFPALGEQAWRRSLVFTNNSDKTVDLARARLDFQTEPAAKDPIAWHQHPFHMVRTQAGKLFCVAKWNEAENVRVHGHGEGGVRADVSAAWRLAPGQSARIQWVDAWLADEDGDDPTRREARRWYAAHGIDQPIRYPDWVYRAIFYEASAAGHIDSRFSDTGGFDAFARQIPYLTACGINAMWLNAVQTHKSGSNPMQGWNHYGPRNQLEIDPILGGAEGFTRLAKTMRENGMHLISEVVPHGGHCVQARALPEWHTRDREGELRRNWGGCGMDNASPEWQDVLKRSMRMLADAGDIEGVRIDVAPGQGPNWGSPRTNHASYSTMGGCLELMGALRDGIRTEKHPVPIMLPESGDQPEYFAVPGTTTLGYGWAFWMFSQKLQGEVLTKPELMNQMLRDFFENERGSLPPGALGLRTLNNHDTVCHSGRPTFRFGAGLQRALHGVLLSVPGVPMLYQEDEIGSFEALRKLHAARQALPQLASAPVVYPPAGFAHPAVFAAVRTDPEYPVLCLTNLSGNNLEIDTQVPKEFAAPRGRLYDAVTSCSPSLKKGRLRCTLPAYRTAFLTGQATENKLPKPPVVSVPAPEVSSKAPLSYWNGELSLEIGGPDGGWRTDDPENAHRRTFVSERGTLTVTQQPKGLSVTVDLATTRENPGLTVTVRGAQRWYVSGRTAHLEDIALRRHYPFPEDTGYVWKRNHAWGYLPYRGLYNGVCPSGRVWQSVVEPLHPEEPAVAFTDRDGRAIALRDLHTDAMNVVLTDASDETPEPARLELRILGIDPDLAVPVQQLGPGQPWRLAGMKPVQSRQLHAEFVVAHAETENLARYMTQAVRLPLEPPGADLLVEAPRVNGMGGRDFLPEPGTLTWRNLAPVPGQFEIELELRLSERSGADTDLADAYEVSLDGKTLPLRWGKKNVWSTGNAYFAKARVGPVDLGGTRHRLAIRTLHTWCAIRPEFQLVPAPRE